MAWAALVAMVGWLVGYLCGRVGRLRWENDLTRKSETEAKRRELESRLAFAVDMRKIAALSAPFQISLDKIEQTAKCLLDLQKQIERNRAQGLDRPVEADRWTDN